MRIKLDLSEFLEDERKFSMVKVNAKETKTVRDVLLKISNLFNVAVGIEGPDDTSGKLVLGLFEDENFFIHPDMASTVLQDAGVLKLKSLPKPGGRKKKRSKKEQSEEEDLDQENEQKERKVKKNKSEEDMHNNSIKEEKKDKKSDKVFEASVCIENEDDSIRKVRKRKRGKTAEETRGQEAYELQEPRKSKKNRTSEEKSETEDEMPMRQKKKLKKSKLSDNQTSDEEEEEVVEMRSLKKAKKSKIRVRVQEDAEPPEEVEEMPIPRKKKSKKVKSSESSLTPDLIVDERVKKNSSEYLNLQEPKINRKRGSWTLSEEELEMQTHLQTERKKRLSKEEKSSQEKVVSTSTIINLESEEALEDSGSSSYSIKSYQQKYNTESKIAGHNRKQFVADSMTDPQVLDDTIFPVKKRKRKHNKVMKRDRQQQWEQKEQETTSSLPRFIEDKHTQPSTSTSYRCSGNNQPPLLNSTFTRKHVHFTSGDEEIDISNEKASPQDIEIVETTTTGDDIFLTPIRQSPISRVTGRTRNIKPNLYKSQTPDTGHPYATKPFRSRNLSHTKTDRRNVPMDLEIEGEEEEISYHQDPETYGNRVPAISPLAKTPSGSSTNSDEWATLRRICENKTITVCKVDSRKEQSRPRAKAAAANIPASPSSLSPPSPEFRTKQESNEIMQTFHNLMSIQNSPMPIVSQNPRQVVQVEDSDSGFHRNKGHNYTHDINGKSGSNIYSSDKMKANGQGLPGSVGSHSSFSRSPITKKHSLNQQDLPRNEASVKETRTTTVLSNIIHERSQRGLDSTPPHRARDTPRRMPQSMGSVLSNLRGCGSESGEVEEGELEILGNSNQSHSTVIKDSSLNRQLLADRLDKPLNPNLKTISPGISSRKKESPMLSMGQNVNVITPTKMVSEVVDLESEEEIEIPVAKSIEVENSKKFISPKEVTAPTEASEFAGKESNDASSGSLGAPRAVSQSPEKGDSKSTPSVVAGLLEGRLISGYGSEGDELKDNLVVEDIVESKDNSPEPEHIYDDIEDDDEDEESGLEEEEEEEEGVEEEEDDDVRVGQEEDGAEVINDDEDELSDIYDDLGEVVSDNDATQRAQDQAKLEKEKILRLEKCLEDLSQSPKKNRPNIEEIQAPPKMPKCAKIIDTTTQPDAEKTLNMNTKDVNEMQVDTNCKLNSEKIMNIASKAQEEKMKVASTGRSRDEKEQKPTTSKGGETPNEDVEDLVKTKEKSRVEVRENKASNNQLRPLQSPSPEVIQVTPAVPPIKVPTTQIHTLIHHTTVTNIVPGIVPNIIPTPAIIPMGHPQFRTPSQTNFPNHPQSSPGQTLFMSLPPQYALNQLVNQSLFSNMSTPNVMQTASFANATHLSSSPFSNTNHSSSSPSTSSQQTPNLLPSIASLIGSPLHVGVTLPQAGHPTHPLLGMPITSPRPRATLFQGSGLFQRPPAMPILNPFLPFQRFPNV